MVYICIESCVFLLVPTKETQSLYYGADLASESGTQLHTRLETRKNSNHVPAPFSAGPAVAPQEMATTRNCYPGIPEAHPHSARRGCTSTNSIPLAGMSSKQAFTSVRWDLKCCCTRVFAVFSLCPKFSLPNPTSAMWWTSLFLANYIREAFRWYHLSSHPLVSLLTD